MSVCVSGCLFVGVILTVKCIQGFVLKVNNIIDEVRGANLIVR